MKMPFGDSMRAATALTQQGKLMEATAAIQRALGQAASQDAHVAPVARRGVMPGLPNELRPAAPEDIREGRFTDGAFSHGGLTRAFKIFVPSILSAHPGLVVMLHGCQQDPSDFARGTRANEHAASADCIVVYPAQSRSANVNGCWNWFEKDHQRRDRGEAGLLAHLVRDLVATHAIDRDRVFVAGLSAGGAMAAVMADEYPDLFAAVCIHSGLAAGTASNVSEALQAMRSGPPVGALASSVGASTSVPTIVFHGAKDHTVNASNAEAIVASILARADRATLSAPDVVRSSDRKGRSVTRTRYEDASGRTVVEHWNAQGGSHAWFGGSPDGSYTDPHGVDATREMLRFFADHPRRRGSSGN